MINLYENGNEEKWFISVWIFVLFICIPSPTIQLITHHHYKLLTVKWTIIRFRSVSILSACYSEFINRNREIGKMNEIIIEFTDNLFGIFLRMGYTGFDYIF